MRRIRYSVAMSLDGYIAGPNGEYDWIQFDPSEGAELFGRLAAASLVDTVETGLIPVLLGEGRKVMAGCNRRIKLVQRPTDLELPGHTLMVYDVQKH